MNQKLASFAFVGLLGLNLTPRITNIRLSDDSSEHVSTSTSSPKPGLRLRLEDGIKNTIRTNVQKFKDTRGTLSGQVTAVGSTSITINSNGTSIQVDVDSNTHFRRKFWGNSSLSEISVGDSVQVVGKWTSDAKTEITAVLIRDTSIQKRFGVFFGTVKSLTSGGFVVTTIHRDDETVTFGTAKIVDRKGGTLSQSDVKVGQKVRVRGMWDSNLKTITETTEVKDFSLPPFATPSPTP